MAFVAHSHHQSHSQSDFLGMDDNMEISSDAGHRNLGDDDDIDIDIDLAPDRINDNTNDDFMADNTHHNPDDDLMFDENTGQEHNNLENMDQDAGGDQYDQLQDIQDQYGHPPNVPQPNAPQIAYDMAPQNPAYDQRRPSSVTPKPPAFNYPSAPDQSQYYHQFDPAQQQQQQQQQQRPIPQQSQQPQQQQQQPQHPDNHFQGHQQQFAYPPQDPTAQFSSGAVTNESRPNMANNLDASNAGYDEQQTGYTGPPQASGHANGYRSSAAPDASLQETFDPENPTQPKNNGISQGNPESQPFSALHPVIVNWNGDHFSLFPGQDDDAYDGYFLEDTAPAFSDCAALMDALRQVLGEDCPSTAELRLAFPVLGLTLTQNSPSNSSVSLANILDVYYTLCLNDGIDYPEPLEAILSTRQDPEIRMIELRQALEDGKGLSQVEAETWNAEDSDNSLDDDSPGYPGASGHDNGDDETADELDEYKEVYEDISAVVKELKTLAPEVDDLPESSDDGDGDGELAEADGQGQQLAPPTKSQPLTKEQPLQDPEHEDLLDDTAEDPVEQATADTSAQVAGKQSTQSDLENQPSSKEDDLEAVGLDDSHKAPKKTEETAAANNDSLSNIDDLEDEDDGAEPTNEDSYLEEDYLETQAGGQQTDSAITNEPVESGQDLLEQDEFNESIHKEADELIDDDEDALEDPEFDTALESTDLAQDQVDDLDTTAEIDFDASAGDEGADSIKATEPIATQASTLPLKRSRDEHGSDELEDPLEANDAKKARSG